MSSFATVEEAQEELWSAVLRGCREGGMSSTLARIEKAIDAGADPNAYHHSGKRLLDVLISYAGLGLPPLIEVLCAKGANPLLCYIIYEHATRFSTATPALVEGCVKGNYKDAWDEGELLHGIDRWAASGMDAFWVEKLLRVAFEAGASVDVLDKHGHNPLHKLWSVRYSDYDMPEHYLASNQWSITNQLYEMSSIEHLLADPILLDLIEATGYIPSQCQPEVGRFPVMEQIEALLEARTLSASTLPSKHASPRPRI